MITDEHLAELKDIFYEDPVTCPAVDFAARAVSYYADTQHFRRISWKYLEEEIERRRPQLAGLSTGKPA